MVVFRRVTIIIMELDHVVDNELMEHLTVKHQLTDYSTYI